MSQSEIVRRAIRAYDPDAEDEDIVLDAAIEAMRESVQKAMLAVDEMHRSSARIRHR